MVKKAFSVLFLEPRLNAEKMDTLSEPLEDKGYLVDTARHIEEANEFLDRRDYDMFLMDITDISMGECLNLIQRIQSLKTDLIVISDHVDDKWYQKALHVGVSTVFTKPINPTLLEDMVDRCKKIKNSSVPYPRGC